MNMRGGCRLTAARYLSHPRDAAKRGYSSTQDEVYTNGLALCSRALVPSALHATASFPDTPTETNGFFCDHERGMMLSPEFCQQPSSRLHAERPGCASKAQMLDTSAYEGRICRDRHRKASSASTKAAEVRITCYIFNILVSITPQQSRVFVNDALTQSSPCCNTWLHIMSQQRSIRKVHQGPLPLARSIGNSASERPAIYC